MDKGYESVLFRLRLAEPVLCSENVQLVPNLKACRLIVAK